MSTYSYGDILERYGLADFAGTPGPLAPWLLLALAAVLVLVLALAGS